MGRGVSKHLVKGKALFFRGLLIDASGGHCKVKYLENGGALASHITAGNPANVVRRYPSLTVGRPGQRDKSFVPCHKVCNFYSVSHRVNIFQVGTHMFVYHDTSPPIA